jgi:hypothetical protein
MSVGDRVWLQVVGPKDPGVYYVATIVSQTYEHPVQPSDPAHFRWRTDIQFDYRIRPPLLRSELVEDVQLGSFRPFRGFEGSNVPVPPEVAAALAARAAPRLEPLWRRRTGPAGFPSLSSVGKLDKAERLSGGVAGDQGTHPAVGRDRDRYGPGWV